MSFSFITQKLEQRQAQQLLRKRQSILSVKDAIIETQAGHCLNFASNDYLGLSQHPQVLQSYAEGLALYGAGATASSVVVGYSKVHQALEADLCAALNKPAALLFSSGFAANQAICHALFGETNPSGEILCDKYMHASFIQGGMDTGNKLKRFKHNNMQHASMLMQNLAASSLVATEGVFSMDGDLGDLTALQSLIADRANDDIEQKPWLMVDDAHAIGVIGEGGIGSSGMPKVDANKIDIIMGTFGKAFGTGGAFIAGSQALIDFLINFSKHYVYSTALSPAQVQATRTSFTLIKAPELRDKLHANIGLFRKLAKQSGLPIAESQSSIQPVIMHTPERALEASKKLAQLGIWVPAIRTPTVPKNADRLRITLSALHHAKDIHALIDALSIVLSQIPARAETA